MKPASKRPKVKALSIVGTKAHNPDARREALSVEWRTPEYFLELERLYVRVLVASPDGQLPSLVETTKLRVGRVRVPQSGVDHDDGSSVPSHARPPQRDLVRVRVANPLAGFALPFTRSSS